MRVPFEAWKPQSSRILVALLLTCCVGQDEQRSRSVTDPLLAEKGVVVEEVGEGSALERAGIEVGDVLLSWQRLPNPPANPEEARGELASPFDWIWLEVEEAPRGTVEVTGSRGEEGRVFTIKPGLWEAEVRPRMSDAVMEGYLRGGEHFEARETAEAASWWEKVAAAEGDWSLRCWILLRLGDVWADQREWEKAHSAYRSALEETREPLPRAVLWRVIGMVYQEQNKFEQARQAHSSAREILERAWGEESLGLAKSLGDLGGVARYRGDLTQAKDLAQQALAIRQKLAPESLDLAQSLNDLGSVAARRGDLDRATTFHQRALETRQVLAPESLAVAESLNNLGMVAHHRGDLERATELYQHALEIYRKLAPESLRVATGLNNLGCVAWARGDLEQAADLLQDALAIRQEFTPDSLHVAESLNNLGVVANDRGDLDQSMVFHQRALEIKRELTPDSLDVAQSLNNLGGVSYDLGDLDQSADLHQRALGIRQGLAPDSLAVAESLNNLGTVAHHRGDLERAAQFYQRALAIRQKLAPGSLTEATVLNNLGAVAWARGDLKRAADFLQGALAIRQKLAPEGIHVAFALDNLGLVSRDRGDLERATAFHQRALAIRKKLAPGSPEQAYSLHNLGKVVLARGDLDSATDLYEHALEIRQKLLPESVRVAETLHAIGLLQLQKNPSQLGIAEDFFRRALHTLENQLSQLGGSHDIRAGFRVQYHEFYRDALETQLELEQPDTAFHTLERSRARSFLEQLTERDPIFNADIPEELDRNRRRLAIRFDRAQQQLSKLNRGSHSDQISVIHDQLRQLRAEARDIEEQIRRASPKLAALRYPRPLDFEAARSVLDPGTLMLSYSVGDATTHLFVVTREGSLKVHSLPISEEDLRYHVGRFQKLTHGRGWPSGKASRIELAKYLYKSLIEPAEDVVQQNDRLLIVPNGPLHLLPFAALIRETEGDAERPWQYLVEWKPLHSVLSATVYAELKKFRRQGKRGSGGEAPVPLIAFGDPDYPQELQQARIKNGDEGQLASIENIPDVYVRAAAEGGFDFPPLPYSRQEVDSIAKLYPGARMYLGAEATEERAKSVGKDTRILHFATHGTLDHRLPFNSAVALTIPEEPSGDRDNGLLQVWEIFERVRIDADLVVLSACQSAVGEELGGEGLISLTRAFQYAGARTVAATLWKVADQTTAVLMTRFYQHLRAGTPKDEALRLAQIELIRSPVEVTNGEGQVVVKDASAPYYWAAFQIIGDWQ